MAKKARKKKPLINFRGFFIKILNKYLFVKNKLVHLLNNSTVKMNEQTKIFNDNPFLRTYSTLDGLG